MCSNVEGIREDRIWREGIYKIHKVKPGNVTRAAIGNGAVVAEITEERVTVRDFNIRGAPEVQDLEVGPLRLGKRFVVSNSGEYLAVDANGGREAVCFKWDSGGKLERVGRVRWVRRGSLEAVSHGGHVPQEQGVLLSLRLVTDAGILALSDPSRTRLRLWDAPAAECPAVLDLTALLHDSRPFTDVHSHRDRLYVCFPDRIFVRHTSDRPIGVGRTIVCDQRSEETPADSQVQCTDRLTLAVFNYRRNTSPDLSFPTRHVACIAFDEQDQFVGRLFCRCVDYIALHPTKPAVFLIDDRGVTLKDLVTGNVLRSLNLQPPLLSWNKLYFRVSDFLVVHYASGWPKINIGVIDLDSLDRQYFRIKNGEKEILDRGRVVFSRKLLITPRLIVSFTDIV